MRPKANASIAAEINGRSCHAMDVDAHYGDVAVQRWEQITGKAAVLARKDRIFSDIATARHS
jgi:DNA modification methylase